MIVTALDKRLHAVLKVTNAKLLASLATAFRTCLLYTSPSPRDS